MATILWILCFFKFYEALDIVDDNRILPGDKIGNSEPKAINLIDLKLLPENYDKRQHPPPEKEGGVNQIAVTMDIYSIPQLDEKKEEIMLEVRLSHYWYDKRLQINFQNPLELEPEAINDFWIPDSYIHHAKDAKQVKLITNPASLRIYPDKRIKYTMMTMVTIGCPMSYQYYPMDKQTCRLELQSFGYSLKYNNYTWLRSPLMKKDINLDNHQVNIEEYSFTYSSDDTVGLRYPGLGIRIDLRRHLGYHIIQTYVPSIIFVIVAWLSFLVPSDIVPGRMVLCVTTLLTLTSMFNSVRSLTPQVSYMKAIDLWVFICICFVFSSLAEYGLILHLTSRSAWQKRVDSHLRKKTGKTKLTSVSPVELLTVTIAKDKSNLYPRTHPDFNIDIRDRRQTHSISDPPAHDPTIPKAKEKFAYAIEWCIKIAYPIAFGIFNIAYWTHYLEEYNDSAPHQNATKEEIFSQRPVY